MVGGLRRLLGTLTSSKRVDLLLRPEAKPVTLNMAVPPRVEGRLTRPTFTPEKVGMSAERPQGASKG